MNISAPISLTRITFVAALLVTSMSVFAQQPTPPQQPTGATPGQPAVTPEQPGQRGPGGPGGQAGARGGRGGRRINLDSAMVFVRPTESPGLGSEMKKLKADKDGFISMFNGKDLTGWDALPKFWSVNKEGVIECVETAERGGNIQSDLIWIDSQKNPEKYTNVEIRVKYRWISQGGNSGVQFRGKMNVDSTKHIAGYQADMDPANNFTGAIYDESTLAGRRTKDVQSPHIAPRGYKTTYLADGGAGKTEPLAEDAKTLATFLKPVKGEFNDMVIVVNGSHVTVTINGHLFSELIDENPSALKAGGIVAIQQHAGAGMQVQFKDPMIKFLK